MTQATTVTFDEWTLHRATGEIERHGKRNRLPDQAHLILEELLASPGQVITREHLIARLWPQGVVDFEASLNAAVRKLRSILGDDAETPRYIETVPRKGYRFIGKISESNQRTAAAEGEHAPLPTPPLSSRPRLDKRTWLLVAMAVIGAVLASFLYLSSGKTPPPRVRLAVMPFENLSPDASNAFFTEGIHEEVVSALANRATNMDVISRTTMMSYRGRAVPIPDIAKSLNATHVLEGSVRREGETVRVMLQLVEAAYDRNIWSRSYDLKLQNTMTLQAQVASEVASQLAVKLSNHIGELPRSGDPLAYDLYLKAKLASQTTTISSPVVEINNVEQWLNKAIELDRNFAAAYLERANVRISKWAYSHDVGDQILEGARADIRTAHHLAGDVAAVLQVQGRYAYVVEMDLPKALSFVDRPSMVTSNDPTVMLYRAFFLVRAGRAEEALALFERVAALDPRNQRIFFLWTAALKGLGRPAEALAVARSFNEHGPGKVYFGDVEFEFAGRVNRLREDFVAMGDSVDSDAQVNMSFDLLRFENRLTELRDLLDQERAFTIRHGALPESLIPGIGKKPLAESRGWAHLLINDSASAAKEGRIIAGFVANEPVTRWNRWYLKVLAAESALFSGDKPRAISEARAAMSLVPHNSPSQRRYSGGIVARIYAWAGAEDDAVDLLNELSAGFQVLGPAEVTRDPLYSIPLKDNLRFQALEKKLEAQIVANQKLL